MFNALNSARGNPRVRFGLLVAVATATIAFAVSTRTELVPVLLAPALIGGLLFGRAAGALTGALSVPMWTTSRQLALDLQTHDLGELAVRMLTFAAAGFVVGWLIEQHTAAESARTAAREAQRRSRKLAADALEAEATERRRISERLHDGALQTMLSVAQDLDELNRGNPAGLQRASVAISGAVQQLREAVCDLHPVTLEQGDLELALRTLAQASAHEAGFTVLVRVDPEATGAYDDLVLSISRELMRNAAKHAQAKEASLSLMRCGPNLVLEVSDDGRGICPEAKRAAVGAGHIGLACIRERVIAHGGELDVNSGGDRGTTIEVRLPLPGAGLQPDTTRPTERSQRLLQHRPNGSAARQFPRLPSA